MSVMLKCEAFFQSDAGRGWSESHILLIPTPVGALQPYLEQFKAMIEAKRVPMLAADRFLKGLRVSYPTSNGQIASYPFKYAPVLYPANEENGSAPSLAVEMRMGTEASQQWSNTYLRGFWDSVEHDEELDFTTAPGKAFLKLLNLYKNALVQGGYGFPAISDTNTQRGKIIGYTIDADDYVLFEVSLNGDSPAMPAAGDNPIPWRAAKLNSSSSVLNKSYNVTVVDPTHVRTAKPRAAGPFLSNGTFTMRGTSFLAYTGMAYAILARRPEGRPTNLGRGRSRAKPAV